jgi:biopolymer transport protein ExbB/TolQ
MTILAFKALDLPNQRTAFAFNPFRGPHLAAESDAGRKVALLATQLAELPPHLRRTAMAQRTREVCHYLSSRGSSETLEDHLKYLSELAAERLHDSYALVRTITWAIPILGFLGTVIGITMAIANITPDQLEASLSEVTAGLAVAFDTTALSLSLSMVLVFCSFVVERAEQNVLTRVEMVGIRDVVPAFPVEHQAQNPLDQAQTRAAEQLLQKTGTLVTWQTELWQNALETLRTRWMATIEQQQAEFTAALRDGMGSTLADHAQQLNAFRGEFLEGYRAISQEVGRLIAEMQQTAKAQQELAAKQTTELWERVRSEAAALRDDQRLQSEQLVQGIAGEVRGWQAALQAATEATTSQVQAIHHQGEVLLQIVDQETELTRLEARLADNIEAVRSVSAFEETLHSLTAAVHLLTIRNRAA